MQTAVYDRPGIIDGPLAPPFLGAASRFKIVNKTYGPERQVGPPGVLRWAAISEEGAPPVAFLGDYMGLAATARKAELFWCLSSKPPVTGQFHQTSWGATITR